MDINDLLKKYGESQLDIDELEAATRRGMFGLDNPGYCIACGAEADGCEPDAEGYTCESCGEPAVCGAEQLFMVLI